MTITTPHGRIPVTAGPGGAGRWPGVIVIYDAGGSSKDARRQVRWLAWARYLAVATDELPVRMVMVSPTWVCSSPSVWRSPAAA